MWNKKLSSIKRYSSRTKARGAMGIEVEIELIDTVSFTGLPDGWRMEGDGSLRRYGYEFVSVTPEPLTPTKRKVSTLLKYISTLEKNVVDSPRTSIHVHYNVQDFTWGQWLSACCAYWLLEELFLDYAGAHRKGNLFCLGAEEADGCIFVLADSFKAGRAFPGRTGYKYAALNLEATTNLGTMEFRALGGTYKNSYVFPWLHSIDTLCSEARKFSKPRDLLEYFEEVPEEEFVQRFLGGDQGITYKRDFLRDTLYTNYSQLLLMVLEAESYVEKSNKGKAKVDDPHHGDSGQLPSPLPPEDYHWST